MTLPHPTTPRVDGELLPCPFCGKSDLFAEREDFTSSYIMCNDCGARGPAECTDSDDEETPGKDAAERSWNTRPNPPSTGGAMDQAWEEINALGGSPDASSYDHGIFATVEKALEIIEKLGGMDPKQRGGTPNPALDRDTVERCAKVADDVQRRMKEECDFGAGIVAKEIRVLIGQPARNVETVCETCDYADMLWKWFGSEERCGAEYMRHEMREGMSSDDFKQMLDDHEAALLAQPARSRNDEAGTGGCICQSPDECMHEGRCVDKYLREKRVECPNCHDANKYGDYEGPTCEVCLGDGFIAIAAPSTNAQEPDPAVPDDELAAWARNWHWNDTASDPADPSIYFRDMRMLKAYIAKCRAAAPPDPAVREAHEAFDRMLRENVIEECAKRLESSYPDHAWLNAACAAIRSIAALPPDAGDKK